MSSFGWDPVAHWHAQGFGWVKQDFPLPPERIRASWAGLELETGYPPIGKSWVAILEEISGWWGTAPDNTSTVNHPTGDGTIPLLPRLNSRSIGLRFVLLAGIGVSGVYDALNEVQQLRRGDLIVDEGKMGFRREVSARLVDLTETRITDRVFRVSATLVADDPLRYSGSQALTNGSNALVNRGDVDAFPVIDLVGPHGALTVTHPGGSFSFPALSSGSRSIDCRNGDVWNGNTRVFVGSGAWPVVRSGGSNWTVSGLGSGSAVVRRFEAWS